MQTYREYAPTQFDTKGLGLDDRQDWLVAPVSQTRDSEVLSRANFKAILESLGGESETIEVHRFGHWGPGWVEIILVHPSRKSEVDEIESSLSDYPVFNEMLFSEMENEECETVWSDCYNEKERAEYLRKHVNEVYPMSGETTYTMLRAAVKGSWYHAANMLPCPSDILY